MTEEKIINNASESRQNAPEEDFPEGGLDTRLKLSYKWLNGTAKRLLDGGCSHGYGTRFFAEKAEETFAVDVDPASIETASKRYPHITFKCSPLEKTDFQNEFFDYIILNDVLEHTQDKIQSLSEMYRILKKGGTIIISTPHKGLFTFLDPYNYGYYFRKYLPRLYGSVFKLVRILKEGRAPSQYNPAHLQKHFHYSEKDLRRMLSKSDFRKGYRIEKIFKSGLFLEVLAMNLESVLSILLKKPLTRALIKPFHALGTLDYWIKYGPLSYNIAVKVIKL